MQRWMAAFLAPLAVGACVKAIGDQEDRDALAAETLNVMDHAPLVRQPVVASPALPMRVAPAPALPLPPGATMDMRRSGATINMGSLKGR